MNFAAANRSILGNWPPDRAAGAGVVVDNFVLSDLGIDLLLQPGVRLVKLDPELSRGVVE